jgi:hypothetical protein
MNLKKLFLYELASGIVLTCAVLLVIIYTPDIILNNINIIIVFPTVFAIYLQILYGKKRWWKEGDLLLFKKTWRVAGIIVMIFLVGSYFFELKAPSRGHLSYFLMFFVFFGPVFLLVRSGIGLFLLKHKSNNSDRIYEVFESAVPNPEGFLIVNHASFMETILFGASVFAISYYAGSYQAIRILILWPLVCIPFFFSIYFENVRKKKQRKMDEMEKFILFKTTSYSAVITLFFLAALYEIKDLSFLGNFINEAWGILIISGFFIIWGITGSVILAKKA